MRKLTIVFFDAGGGHRNAAEALKSTLETQSRPWDVRLLNLQELLDSIDVIRRATGIRIQDGYKGSWRNTFVKSNCEPRIPTRRQRTDAKAGLW